MYPHDNLGDMSGKDAGLRIRIERELREAFQEACLAVNRSASDVLREFMHSYVQRHQGGQGDLFAPPIRKQKNGGSFGGRTAEE